MIETLRDRYPCPIGYSGHEVGLPTTVAAVAMGACYVERHITLDRAICDHAASVEPEGFTRFVNTMAADTESTTRTFLMPVTDIVFGMGTWKG